jgi:hypothetical protein
MFMTYQSPLQNLQRGTREFGDDMFVRASPITVRLINQTKGDSRLIKLSDHGIASLIMSANYQTNSSQPPRPTFVKFGSFRLDFGARVRRENHVIYEDFELDISPGEIARNELEYEHSRFYVLG